METKQILFEEKRTAGAHVSFWIASNPAVQSKPLTTSTKSDVVIIGGGIAGMTIAYTLCKRGLKVALVDDGFIGSGESGRTTAHLVTSLDDRYYKLEKIFGEQGAKLAAESHAFAIDYIEQIIQDEHIDCDFKRVDGYLFLHPSDKKDALERELKATIKAGVHAEMVDQIPGLLKQEGKAIKFPNQAEFHIMKYLNGLCAAILRMGGQIYTETHAEKIQQNGIVTTEGFAIAADHIVVATNAPITSMYIMPLKQFPYRSYVIAGLVKKGEVPQALWWDTGDHDSNSDIHPYHYIRTSPYNDEYDLLISGGEDHPTGLADANGVTEEHRYEKLEAWTREHFPLNEILYRWSGQVMETVDCLAYIGRSPGEEINLYVATGDSGNGMTHGTIAGLLIPDLIQGIENKWKDLYEPDRFKFFKTGKAFIKENIDGLWQYFKTNPKHTEAERLKGLKKGEGMIVKLNKEKYGVYRDNEGVLHWVSAECTHLKCIIKWNNDEKTWDCPCHGSRFSFKGEVMNGPANDPLEYHMEKYPDFAEHSSNK
jgi:glycine/D-amino acid oxidase-like deaminating enzyme/nitrite reductase/ring-hydroxylating ferredoxin subunit